MASAKEKLPVLHQKLAALTQHQAGQLLGEEGAARLVQAAARWEPRHEDEVFLGADLYRVRISDVSVPEGVASATVTLKPGRKRELQTHCGCGEPEGCMHVAAGLAYLLENKAEFGFAAPPDQTVPLEQLTEAELHERAMDDRQQRAETESMRMRAVDASQPWTDYLVTSGRSGRTYRVALRGLDGAVHYCSCPDFRTNGLGTCKHILHALAKVQKRFSKAKLAIPYRREHLSVRMDYGEARGAMFNVPDDLAAEAASIVGAFGEEVCRDASELVRRIRKLEQLGHEVHVYPDAEEWIERELVQSRLQRMAALVREAPAKHPLRRELLNAELLPYQLDGIAFAVGAGRAILADEMGLGKTIQAIGTAELLREWADIRRVLVICPASLKGQWRDEIERFVLPRGRESLCQIVAGTAEERWTQYRGDAFYTICNYEQVLRDLTAIEQVPWDLIVLDEGQRIKNWQSKTSQVIRGLSSRFALVLSGTPLENRLDELYTLTQFVDEHRLGPAFRFFHRHREVDERGKVTAYRNLDQLREQLKPILLRRTRAQVAREMPQRTDQVVWIEPTAEQVEISQSNLQVAAQIANKKFLTEMDLLRLQKALLMARMAADSTYLVDKQEPEYSTKLERLHELLEELLETEDRKIVLFSEWTTMLDRITRRLELLDVSFVRLDGSVPQKRRTGIIRKFQDDPTCRLIMMTNAGSTGLNLQSANVVINVDLPWNPAVLEQRIARAYRMGQTQPVHVYKLVTRRTIEERLLGTLAMKQSVADAALELDSDVSRLKLESALSDLRQKLEQVLGPGDQAPVDESQKQRVEAEAEAIRLRRERVSLAGGQLVGAALQMVGELTRGEDAQEPDPQVTEQLHQRLAECVERDETGKPTLRISLPGDDSLKDLAQTLARLLG